MKHVELKDYLHNAYESAQSIELIRILDKISDSQSFFDVMRTSLLKYLDQNLDFNELEKSDLNNIVKLETNKFDLKRASEVINTFIPEVAYYIRTSITPYAVREILYRYKKSQLNSIEFSPQEGKDITLVDLPKLHIQAKPYYHNSNFMYYDIYINDEFYLGKFDVHVTRKIFSDINSIPNIRNARLQSKPHLA